MTSPARRVDTGERLLPGNPNLPQGLISPTPMAGVSGPAIVPGETASLREEETVEGRAAGIMNRQSPLMKMAETYGLQTANKRGLLDSSLAAQSAQGEIIKAAVPIAQADAGALQQQRQAILQGDIQEDLYGTQARYASDLSKQAADQDLAQVKYTTTADTNLRMKLANMDITNREKTALGDKMTALGGTLTEQIANIQRDPNLKGAAKDVAIQSVQRGHKSTVDTLASIYGVKISWTSVMPKAKTTTKTPETGGGSSLAPYVVSGTGIRGAENKRSFPQVSPGYYLYDGKLMTKTQIDEALRV